MGTEGLAELFVAHRRKLEALARGIVRDRDDAADVVSDAFVAFLERGPRSPDEAGAWLYVVTRNKARNRVRDRARAARRPLPVLEPVVDAPPVDERVVALLAAASDALPARDARAIEFRYRHGLEYAEIAAALGISAATARVLVHRASRRLRSHTVGLLADHHGASASCRSEMLREAIKGRVRTHDGCSSCSAVAEEVHALAARGAFVLPVPVRDHLIDNPLNRWLATHWPGRVVTPSPRAAEAFAALVVSGTLVIGGAGSQQPLPSAATAGPAPVRLPAPAALTISQATMAPALGDALEDVAAAPQAIDATLALPARQIDVFEDRAGDADDVGSDLFDLPQLLGVPLVLHSATATNGPASGDVRTLHVGTRADDAGHKTGLYFRIGLTGAPDGLASYNVEFQVGDTPCSWSLWVYPDMEDGRFLGTFDTSLSETCSPQTSDEETAGDGGFTRGMLEYAPYGDDLAMEFGENAAGGFDKGYNGTASPYPATLSGRGVAIEIPFGALSPRHHERLRNADALHELAVTATADLSTDRLPDQGGVDYRIERGA